MDIGPETHGDTTSSDINGSVIEREGLPEVFTVKD